VVAFPKACHLGCESDCKSLPFDPPCFGDYYKQQLRVIEWSRTPEVRAVLPIDESLQVGVAGHSMGGQARQCPPPPATHSGPFLLTRLPGHTQATAFTAAFNASSHDIGGAVMHHPFTHVYPTIGMSHSDSLSPPPLARRPLTPLP